MTRMKLLLLPGIAAGHGAMSFPKPRQSLDGALAPWSKWRYPGDAIKFCEHGKDCAGACPISAHKAGAPDALNASNGQACYWFSNGCTIGCDKCDGTNNHFGHGGQRFLYKGMSLAEVHAKNLTIPAWTPAPGDMELDPASTAGLKPRPNCARPAVNATVCDPRLRTVNTQAPCGSPLDIYYWSPWRHPGSAPVLDACGVAGGRRPGQGIGPNGASFENSSLASLGDLGSKLPPMPSQATWAAGAEAEVGWTVMAAHGGGYAYRLAPADGPLSEEAFRKTPLPFVGPSALRWGGDASAQLEFDPKAKGWETSVGTVPAGSSWRKVPLPSALWFREGPSFEPVCDESDECKRAATLGWDYRGPPGVCKCTGHSNGGPLLPNLEMVDKVVIPPTLAPGKYVVQWRWDCEETDQVWTSCADVTIVAAEGAAAPAAH